MERYLTQMGKKREEELGRVMGQSPPDCSLASQRQNPKCTQPVVFFLSTHDVGQLSDA
jgi:hypothetical protein